MSNEVRVLQGATFNYEYQPASIDITDYEGLLERAEMVAEHYDKMVFKTADLSDINLAHKELNSFIIGLEDSRKQVKREYQKPLREFEKKIKRVTGRLDEPLQKIKAERDSIEDAQTEVRTKALTDHIERRLKDTNVKFEDLTIEDSWSNKGGWTDKLNPRKPLKEEIDRHIKTIQEENKKMIADRKVLETFLDDKKMEREGWMSQLEHKDALEIIQEIVEVEKKRKEKEKKLAEQRQREAEEEVPAEPEPEEQPEPAKPEPEPEPEPEAPQKKALVISEIIEIITTKEKMILLDQFMRDNQITYKPYTPKSSEDDLPF